MADTGYRFPTGDSASTGTWTNPAQVSSNDANVAVCKISTKNTSSFRIQTNYGFTTSIIADVDTIDQVLLQVEWRVTTNTGIARLGVSPMVSGVRLSTYSNLDEPTSLTTDTYDITGTTSWSPPLLRDGVFQTMLVPSNGNNATDPGYQFDYVALDVLYTPFVAPAQRVLRSACNLDGVGPDGLLLGNALE